MSLAEIPHSEIVEAFENATTEERKEFIEGFLRTPGNLKCLFKHPNFKHYPMMFYYQTLTSAEFEMLKRLNGGFL